MLKAYTTVFAEPKGLPPTRAIDHHIPIKARTNQVNVCPSQSHFQKKMRLRSK